MSADLSRRTADAQAPAEGDVWALIERYAAAKVDCATNPTHESAKAYAKLAESNLRDALAAKPQAAPVAPLSERAILDLVPSTMPMANDFELLWFARAVERAHGIHAHKEPNNGR